MTINTRQSSTKTFAALKKNQSSPAVSASRSPLKSGSACDWKMSVNATKATMVIPEIANTG